MALAVLILIGALFGWAASILAMTEDATDIVRQLAIGVVASLIAGVLVNNGTIIGSLSLTALGAGSAAAIVLLIAYHAILRPSKT